MEDKLLFFFKDKLSAKNLLQSAELSTKDYAAYLCFFSPSLFNPSFRLRRGRALCFSVGLCARAGENKAKKANELHRSRSHYGLLLGCWAKSDLCFINSMIRLEPLPCVNVWQICALFACMSRGCDGRLFLMSETASGWM